MRKKLLEILKPYDNWSNDTTEEMNEEAKEVLYVFYKEFVKLKPSTEYEKRDIFHTSYIRHLVLIKKAFMAKQYMRVSNELSSIIYYEPFHQRRIYFNILNLLKENLCIEVD